MQYLDLSYQKLGKITIKNCPNLKALYLFNCELDEIVFEGEFQKLQLIDLTKNRLTSLNLPKENFQALQNFFINQNQLKDLQFLSPFIIADEYFDFGILENPLVEPPPEIVKEGNEAIRRHYQRLNETGKDYIYEAKLLILGEGGAGKTTLTEKLKNSNADLPVESTKGIDVNKITFQYQGKELLLNVWDFAGQEIYSSTHRFFLTHRSLYVIVADARKNDTDFYYWLHTVETFGENSPVLVLINEKFDHKKELDADLREKFENLKEKYDVNLAKIDKRFEKLRNDIEHYVANLEHIGTTVPYTWKLLREDLLKKEKNGEKVLSLKEFRNLCLNYNIKDEKDQNDLRTLFHDLGVFLNFHDNSVLHKVFFIDKDWILNAAYMVIDNKIIDSQKGKFNRIDIEKWLTKDYSDYIEEIIALMKKFYLIYEKDNFFIAPLKLPEEKEKYSWDESDNLIFIFDYGYYMPAGILSQFTVEMHEYIKDNLVWLRGVILYKKDTDTIAEIIENKNEKKITIKTSGLEKEEFRSAIISVFERINKQYKKVQVKRLVPCLCIECSAKNNKNPYFFDFNVLLKAKSKKSLTVQCQKSFEDVQVSLMLSSIKYDFKDKTNEPKKNQPTVEVNVNVNNATEDKPMNNEEKKEPEKEKLSEEEKEIRKTKLRRKIFWALIVVLVVTTIIAFVINIFYPSIWSWVLPYVIVFLGIIPAWQKILDLIKTTIDIADKY